MNQLTRRAFLRLCGTSSIGLALAACGVTPSAVPLPTITSFPTTIATPTNTSLPRDIAMPTPIPLEKLDIAKNYDTINKTAILFLQDFGPAFTNTPKGHIETDIAGAAIISGLMLLRASRIDLTKYKPGTVLLSDIHDAQDQVFRFMMNAAYSMGLEYKDGWATPIPDDHKPLIDPLELTRKLESPFYEACSQTGIGKDYYPYVAALTAMKLVAAGKQTNILDLNIGKGIAAIYVAMGSKLVPDPLSAK
jgi:hypothetical protein